MKSEKKLVRTMNSGLELYKIGHGCWEIVHPEDKKAKVSYSSKAEALEHAPNLTGEIGVYVSFHDEDGANFSKSLVGHHFLNVLPTEKEALEDYKKSELAELQKQMDRLQAEMDEINAL